VQAAGEQAKLRTSLEEKSRLTESLREEVIVIYMRLYYIIIYIGIYISSLHFNISTFPSISGSLAGEPILI